jgi:hypothetical protein
MGKSLSTGWRAIRKTLGKTDSATSSDNYATDSPPSPRVLGEPIPRNCPFLTIAQELRDQILWEAIIAELAPNFAGYQDWSTKGFPGCMLLDINNFWSIVWPQHAPYAAYLNLLCSCRQLRKEVACLLGRPHLHGASATAKLRMELSDWHLALTLWDHLPLPPRQTDSLEIVVKACNLDGDYEDHQTAPHMELARLVFELLRRYIQ